MYNISSQFWQLWCFVYLYKNMKDLETCSWLKLDKLTHKRLLDHRATKTFGTKVIKEGTVEVHRNKWSSICTTVSNLTHFFCTEDCTIKISKIYRFVHMLVIYMHNYYRYKVVLTAYIYLVIIYYWTQKEPGSDNKKLCSSYVCKQVMYLYTRWRINLDLWRPRSVS